MAPEGREESISMKQGFTEFWMSLSANMRSVCINICAILLAVALLFGAKAIFPDVDFSAVQAIVVTALSAFVVSLVKNIVIN